MYAMLTDALSSIIMRHLGFSPSADQLRAIGAFSSFMVDRSDRVAMVMRGSAGTGKTTLAAAIVKALSELRWRMVLLAPTGRAAKVFALGAGRAAFTIHRRIYRQKSLRADMGGFSLADNLHSDTLFIVDEASMIANGAAGEAAFGSGCLLDDLVHYVYGGRNCRLMLIGDRAQLPPVGEAESPALQAAVMEGYGLRVYEAELDAVLRQGEGSGILFNATTVRRMITGVGPVALPKVRFSGFADICAVGGGELVDTLAGSYSHAGLDETIVITRSNKRAVVYNRGIRAQVLDREDELCAGDMIMVVRNNYYWMERERRHADGAPKAGDGAAAGLDGDAEAQSVLPSFLANGDRAVVRRVRGCRSLYGFRFADVTMTLPDYDDYELTATVLLDTLASEAPALTREQGEQLFNAVMEDYADLPLKADRIKQLKQDRYFNALQVKHAYAVTCHKAQGGQWAHVYVDQGYMTDDMLTPAYLHWLYTAFTRATERLYLVNWPDRQRADAG